MRDGAEGRKTNATINQLCLHRHNGGAQQTVRFSDLGSVPSCCLSSRPYQTR